MSLGHNRSENTIMSHAQASDTIWTPISCRSLPDGRDFSSDDPISHTLWAYTKILMFFSHILLPNLQTYALSTHVWKRLFCTPVIFSSQVVSLDHADLNWIGKRRSFPSGKDSLVRGSFLNLSRTGDLSGTGKVFWGPTSGLGRPSHTPRSEDPP